MTQRTPLTLEDLGWNDFFAAAFEPHAKQGLVPARVIRESRGVHGVTTGDTELSAASSGRLWHGEEGGGPPAVGDWVAVRLPTLPEEPGLIRAILPRKSKFSRKAAGARTDEQVVAANVDTAFLMTGLDHDFSPRRIERYLTAAWESGVDPVLLLNKADLDAELEAHVHEVETIAMGLPVHAISAKRGEGIEALAPYLGRGKTISVLGSSGVGKSTLINRLLGSETQRIGAVRQSDDRGRHTTTHRELFMLPGGGLILDTPGMRELQLWEADEGFGAAFADIEELAAGCRFGNCHHTGEPGCSVEAAVASGELAPERLESWRKLQREMELTRARQDELIRLREKQRVKAIHKAQRNFRPRR
ncbi:MAG TPA: ribosome small subunit-dependent GTPase A [Thermoanaerobaculia bacterium]|nr:ribosome small subunit-dependent GTPase A [Thermoanaerobaculia bacterium]